MLSTDIALYEITIVLIICILVVLKYSATATFNKLTLLPYYFMLLQSTLALVQYYSTGLVGKDYKMVYILNMARANSIFAAIAIQTFEWLNTWFIISFQKEYDITEIPIEKRRYQKMEAIRRRVFFGIIAAIYAVAIGLICYALMTEKPLTKYRQQINRS